MQEFDYDEITSALERYGIAADAADCQGSITATACMNGPSGFQLWLESYLEELQDRVNQGDALARETYTLLQKLYQQVCHQLENGEFDYALLLPDDDVDLELRTEAMSHWCQGFLMGLRYSGVTDFNKFTGELGEIIDDITEISQVSAGQLDYSEEEEQSYAELVEYLRVGVMLFNETLNSQVSDTTPSIH
ncbi:MAG: UPF0149 family protein [Thioalkalispiraceae bacterium]|jgi:uncharacterized protein YgfB (UPF0149 family)